MATTPRPRYRPVLPRIITLLRGDWRDISAIIIYAVGVGLASLAVPIAVKSLVNSVAFGTLLQPLVVLTSLVLGVLLFSGIMAGLQLYVVEILQRRLLVRLALTLAHRLPHVQYYRFKEKYGPEYALRFMEAFATQKTVKLLLLDGIAVVFQTLVGITLLGFYHPFFLAFSLALVLFMFFFIMVLARPGVRTSIKESDAKYEVFAWLQDLATIPVLFKSVRGEAYAIKRTDDLTISYLDGRKSHFKVLLTQNIAALLLQALGSAALLGIGGYLVINQQLTLGQLVAAELILTIVLTSVTKLGKHLETFYDLAASIAKLDSLMDIPFEERTGSYFGIDQSAAKVEIRKLTIRFGETTVLNDISLTLQPGEKVAVWGGNGSGKSLLASAIYRLVTPTSGRIEIDGHNVNDIHPLELRSEVVLVRGIEIFRGTLLDNLTLGHALVNLPDTRRALTIVGLNDEISALPEGMQTLLKPDGNPLSKGQAHQLMIARAIILRPRLLVLDGTLDSIDDDSRNLMLASLTTPETPWTLVVFTHDDEVLREFDRAYQIKQGSIIALAPGTGHV